MDAPYNLLGITLVTLAICGFAASLSIPPAPSVHPETVVNFNLWRGNMEIIAHAKKDPVLVRIILTLSWFIVVGFVYISQIANYARSVVHADNKVYIVFLSVFSLGMAAGSLICDSLLKGQISTRFTSISAVGVAIFTFLMIGFTNFFVSAPISDELAGVTQFFSNPSHFLIVFPMFMVAACGGICMTPLYAAMQTRTNPKHRSQIIATSNLSDSVAMTIAAIASVAILSSGFGVQELFIAVAIITLAVAFFAR